MCIFNSQSHYNIMYTSLYSGMKIRTHSESGTDEYILQLEKAVEKELKAGGVSHGINMTNHK